MNELRQLLQDKYDWLTTTTGAKHVSVKLDASQLSRIMSALREYENPALPKIEPRMLHPQEPRGTRLSPEEVSKALSAIYDEIQGQHAAGGLRRALLA